MTITGPQLQRRCGAHLMDGRVAVCDAGNNNMPEACAQHPVTPEALHAALQQLGRFAMLPLADRVAIVERQARDRFPIMDCPYRCEFAGVAMCSSAAMLSALRAEEKVRLAAIRKRVQAKAAAASTSEPEASSLKPEACAPERLPLADPTRPSSLGAELQAKVRQFAKYQPHAFDTLEAARRRERALASRLPGRRRRGY